jgi:hypothetical protein
MKVLPLDDQPTPVEWLEHRPPQLAQEDNAMVSIQFPGELPRLDRAARREWLHSHFNTLSADIPAGIFALDHASLSVSGQSIEARCVAMEMPKLTKLLESSGHRVALVRTLQAVPANARSVGTPNALSKVLSSASD